MDKCIKKGALAAAAVNALQQFRVLTGEPGRPGEVQVSIVGPTGLRCKAQVLPCQEGHLVSFRPTELGEYELAVSYQGAALGPTPLRLSCLACARAYGPGLSRGIANWPAEFVIDTRGAGQGGLGVTVEGPCEAAINCRDNGDGTCSVAYLPTESGDYAINITFNELHLPGSPFQAIVHDLDLGKIRLAGPGLQPHGQHRPALRHYPHPSALMPPHSLSGMASRDARNISLSLSLSLSLSCCRTIFSSSSLSTSTSISISSSFWFSSDPQRYRPEAAPCRG
jgi:hypothetical protein